jgi:hypothetical protein
VAHAPRAIFHYTCDHGAAGILTTGIIKPNPQPMLAGLEVAWFTDLALPVPAGALGMARPGEDGTRLTCDRYAHTFTVDGDQVAHWPIIRRALVRTSPELRSHIRALEQFAMPMHWWVSDVPVAIHPPPSTVAAAGHTPRR